MNLMPINFKLISLMKMNFKVINLKFIIILLLINLMSMNFKILTEKKILIKKGILTDKKDYHKNKSFSKIKRRVSQRQKKILKRFRWLRVKKVHINKSSIGGLRELYASSIGIWGYQDNFKFFSRTQKHLKAKTN